MKGTQVLGPRRNPMGSYGLLCLMYDGTDIVITQSCRDTIVTVIITAQ